LLLALCAAVVLWVVFSTQKQSVKLADGTTLTFHAVTTGLSNRYCFGNPVQRMAAKLPWSWAQRYAASSVLTGPIDRDTNLVVWVTFRGAAPRAGSLRFRCIHDGGTNELGMSGITKYGLPSGESGTGFYTPFWPRRSKGFTLQALDASAGEKPLWEIRVPNPLQLDYPEWKPEILPGGRAVGDVSFTLEELVPSESRPASTPQWHPTDSETVQARLRVTSGERPSDDWEICAVRFRDALGNPFQQFPQHKMRSHGGRHDLDFVMPLFAGERAGKLGVAFVRARGAPTNELFTLPELGLPSAGKHLSQTLRTNTPLGEISLFVLAHNSSPKGIEVSAVSLQLPGRDLAKPGAVWFQPFAAVDDRGRSYSLMTTAGRQDDFDSPAFIATAGRPDLFDSSTFRRIRVPRDARTLVLTVAPLPVVFVEYTVGRESITRRQ